MKNSQIKLLNVDQVFSYWPVYKVNACLPKRKMKGPNRTGWSQDVQPYKEASVRCHTIWTEYGEPQAGEVYDNIERDEETVCVRLQEDAQEREVHEKREDGGGHCWEQKQGHVERGEKNQW